MKYLNRLVAGLSVAAFALLIPPRAAFAATPPDSKAIPKLLDEVKMHAGEANDDAVLLESYGRIRISNQTYASTLEEIRKHANDLLQDYYKLQRARDGGTPAQQAAIDRLEPVLRDMASELTNSIRWLNGHKMEVGMAPFQNHIRAVAQRTDSVYQGLCQCTGKNAKI